ncbi:MULTISPECIES: type II secretion system protein [Bhargavaea]|uniref:Competence protein ComGE n=1 Tax=Bhargavaea changchunensis TaxID=2134037 RepID=A0ABW2NFW1_9BACL|nr:type II secretion system protein [Bhargavaea sp. CC-171006]
MTGERGFSFPESLLALLIVYVIFTSLLPLTNRMTIILEEQKLAAQAASVASDALDEHFLTGEVEGSRGIGNVIFDWRMQGGGICVSYKATSGWQSRCYEPGK